MHSSTTPTARSPGLLESWRLCRSTRLTVGSLSRLNSINSLINSAESAFDPKHPYYDPKSNRDSPKWSVVHVEFRHKLKKQVTLADLKANSQAGKPLENLMTLKQSRLSVSKVTPDEWRTILEMAGEDPHGPKF